MKILLLTDDLMSRVRIESRWKVAGAQLLTDRAAADADLIVVDLGARGALERIRSLREAYPAMEILAFGPHVDADRFREAKAAGATQLVARGAVTDKVLTRIAARA